MHLPSKYPTDVCGPASCKGPLSGAIVRVVLGNTRYDTPAVKWLPGQSPRENEKLTIECDAFSFEDCSTQRTFHLLPTTEAVPNLLLNFSVNSLADFHLSFEVSARSRNRDRRLLARASVLGSELLNLIGVLSRPLLNSNGKLVGVLTFEFLLIKPFVMPSNPFVDLKSPDKKRHRESLTNFTGHRGMGKTSPYRLKENTVFSFVEATSSRDVSHVELDVQLTKDGYPVVYHDWFFRTRGRDKDDDATSLPVPIYSLTLAELNDLYTSGVRKEPFATPSASHLEKTLAPLSDDPRVRSLLATDKIRTLAEVFTCLPSDVGVMVEVKYPSPNEVAASYIPYPERNDLIDRILHDVFRVKSNARRSIIFLSFEPDVCAMLALKQNCFPVFFSNCDGKDKPCEDLDPRCIRWKDGVEFAESQRLDGVLLWEEVLQHNEGALKFALDKGLAVLTYGKGNGKPEWAAEQIRDGVASVIADDVLLLVEEAVKESCTEQDAKPRRSIANAESVLNFEHEKLAPYQAFSL